MFIRAVKKQRFSFSYMYIFLGTEAAAATVIEMVRVQSILAPKPKPIEFKADRAFLFFIREVEQDLILFSGKLVTP